MWPDIAFLSHAFAYLDPDALAPMTNPWQAEFDQLTPSPPAHLVSCNIINVHIYYSYKLRYRIQTWDEYRQRTLALFEDFLSVLRGQQGAGWDVVNRKPIWISEFGVSYNFAGLDEIPGQKWGNSSELATFRVATYDALANHPDVDACFYYTMRNELAAYDERDHDFNEGILLNGDADLPISYTPSYALFGYSNGVDEPEVPIEYAPAPEPVIAGV